MTFIRSTLAAFLITSIGAPAFSLDLSEFPQKVAGVYPGMELNAAAEIIQKAGMPLTREQGSRGLSNADLLNENGLLIGSAFIFQDPKTMDTVYLEVGTEATGLDMTVFRVTGLINPEMIDKETQKQIVAAAGQPTCGREVFRYTSDWQPAIAERCNLNLLQPLTPLSEDSATYAVSDGAPKYSALLGKMPGNNGQLMASVQDNHLAGLITLPDSDPIISDSNDDGDTAPNMPEAEDPELPVVKIPELEGSGVEIVGVKPGMALISARDALTAQGFEVIPPSKYAPKHKLDELLAENSTITFRYGNGGRERVRIPAHKELKMRRTQPDGSSEGIVLTAWADNQVYMIDYSRGFPQGGPYPVIDDIMSAASSRVNDAPATPMKNGTFRPESNKWFMTADGTFLTEAPATTFTIQSYTDAYELWEVVEQSRGDDPDRDFMTFQAYVKTLNGDDAHLVSSFQLKSLNLNLIVPKLQEAYLDLFDETTPDTRSDIEF